MIFKTERKTTDKVFSTAIVFSGYGDNKLSDTEEQALIDDFGSPVINLGALTYTGKFAINDDTRVVADDSGDEISIIVNTKALTLDNNFKAEYVSDSKKFLKSDYSANTVINTPELLAEARCLLFEETVKAAIADALKALKEKTTRFETVDIPDFTA
jgi:hypothetical protein